MRKNRIINFVLLFVFLVLLASCKNKDIEYAYSIDKYGILNKNLSELYEFIYNKQDSETNDESIETAVCQIHEQDMVIKNIEIIYGLIRPTEAEAELNLRYYALQTEYFPNCNNPKFGGGVMGSPYYFEKYVCNECNRIRDLYKKVLGIK